ncbi:unnamed protein product, partial [Laminaria digitata]
VAAAGPVALPAVLPVVAPHAEGGPDAAGAAGLPAEDVEAPLDSASHGSAHRDSEPPAAEVEPANLAMPSLEEIDRRVPSMERMYLVPPPVVEAHREGHGDGAGAALPPTGAIEAPPAAALPVAAEPANEALPVMEEIDESVDPVLRPFPGRLSPAQVLANHMANNLRILGC